MQTIQFQEGDTIEPNKGDQIGKLTIKYELGRGSFSYVLLVEDMECGKYAAKVFKNEHEVTEENRQYLQRVFEVQADIMKKFKVDGLLRLKQEKPNVQIMKGRQSSGRRNVLILEYVDGGSLYDHLAQKRFPQEFVRYLYKNHLLCGLLQLHQQKIAHRDLKPQNILFTHKDFNLRICDFGCAGDFGYGRDISIKRSTQVGTQLYMAPQIQQQKPYDQKVDIFSAGVMLLELILGTNIFAFNKNGWKQLLKAQNYKNFWSKVKTCSQRIELGDDLKDLVVKMIAYNPEKRLSCKDFFYQAWFAKQQQYHPFQMKAQLQSRFENIQKRKMKQRQDSQKRKAEYQKALAYKQEQRDIEKLPQYFEQFNILYKEEMDRIKRVILEQKIITKFYKNDIIIDETQEYAFALLKLILEEKEMIMISEMNKQDIYLQIEESDENQDKGMINLKYQYSSEYFKAEELEIEIEYGRTKKGYIVFSPQKKTGYQLYYIKWLNFIKKEFAYCMKPL